MTTKTIIVSVCALMAADVFSQPMLSQGWDELLPGTQVHRLTDKAAQIPVSVSAKKESRIYVSNAVCVSEPNSLCYDFRDFVAGQIRGYSSVDLPETDGATELQFCFYYEHGIVLGEIRGFYSRPKQGKYGVESLWSFFNIVLGGVFAVYLDGNYRSQAICVGEVRPRIWHRATIRIPPVNTKEAVGSARLERMRPDGTFVSVGEVEVPYGELVLKEVKMFDLYGRGPCKFSFDDLIWRKAP